MSDLDALRVFAAEKHPRAPKGSDVGGEFAPAKQSGKGPKTGTAKTAGHGATHHDSGTLSYDGKTGTGYGSKNGDARVHKLQEALNRLGITDSAGKRLVDDGKLGPKTTSAVKAAQKRLGLPVDGKVTPAFLAKLASTKAPPHRSAPMLLLADRADATKPYGDVPYADPGHQKDGKKRYPIDTAAHAKAAWSYINQAGNASQYSPEDLKRVKARIMAACKKFGIEVNMNSRPDIATLCVRSFEFEQRATGDGRTLEGYAAVFNTPTRIRDRQGDFDEVILPGAFKRSLGERAPILQWDHGKDPAVGTVPIGAFEDIREDDHGLYVRARLFDHPSVDRVRQAIAGKAVKGMSFRFGVPTDGDAWSRQDSGLDLREIRDADIHECGPVAFPAYQSTSVAVRSLLAAMGDEELRALVHELADMFGIGVDLHALADDGEPEDLTVATDTRSADGGDPDTEPGHGAASPMHLRQRLDDGALRARGILK